MIYVIALNWRQFDYYCQSEHVPPINPHKALQHNVVALVAIGNERALISREWQPEDKLVKTGQWQENKYLAIFERALITMGCPDLES